MGLYHQLLDSVRTERGALVQADLKSIHEATGVKEALLAMIQQSELKRIQIVEAISADWIEPAQGLTLTRIIERVQGENLKLADQLRSVFNALTVLVGRVRESNVENQRLVEESLKHVNVMKKNVLGEGQPGGPAYDRQGQRKAGAGGARFIAQEA